MTEPRLLTDRAAADYLSLPIAALTRLPAGRVTVGGRVRWDRQALDQWLDGLIGRAPHDAHANQNATRADEALAQWLEDQKNAAGRS